MSTLVSQHGNQPFHPGSWVLYRDEAWRFLGLSGSGEATVARVSHVSPIEVPVSTIRPLSSPRLLTHRLKPFSTYPEPKQAIAIHRRKVLTTLFEEGWTAGSARDAANQLGVSLLTLSRLCDAYILSGHRLEVLVPGVYRYGLSHRNLNQESEAVLRECMAERWQNPNKIPFAAFVGIVRSKCQSRGCPVPSQATICRRLKLLPKKETALLREGTKAARDMYKPLPGKAPHGGRPLGKVEVDHTILNLFALLPCGRKLRPWITVAIDVYTRMVLGFWLSFDEPSRLSVGLCLFRAMMPKEEWLRNFGITTSWPCSGRSSMIQADNAKEFTSYDLDRICLEQNIILQWRQVKRPEYGGHIERLMGAVSYAMELFPGKSFRSITEKGDRNPEDMAVMPLELIERALLHFFVEVYNHRPHRGLRNRSPIWVWNESHKSDTQPGNLRHVAPQASGDLLFSLLPSFERTIQQDGVSWEAITYFDFAFTKYIRIKNPDSPNGLYRFHYDPRNIRQIYWKDPLGKQWLQIQSTDLGMPDMSLWERDSLLQRDREEAKSTIQGEVIARGVGALNQIAEEQNALALKTHKAEKRKKAERKRKAKGQSNLSDNLTTTVPVPLPGKFQAQPSNSLSDPDPGMWDEIPRFGKGTL